MCKNDYYYMKKKVSVEMSLLAINNCKQAQLCQDYHTHIQSNAHNFGVLTNTHTHTLGVLTNKGMKMILGCHLVASQCH